MDPKGPTQFSLLSCSTRTTNSPGAQTLHSYSPCPKDLTLHSFSPKIKKSNVKGPRALWYIFLPNISYVFSVSWIHMHLNFLQHFFPGLLVIYDWNEHYTIITQHCKLLINVSFCCILVIIHKSEIPFSASFYMSYTGKISVEEKSWTDKGLCIKPEIAEFSHYTEVKISYSFLRAGTSHQETLSDQEFSYPGPHELEGINVTSVGILTAKATDGFSIAECQIPIGQGMLWYIREGELHFKWKGPITRLV